MRILALLFALTLGALACGGENPYDVRTYCTPSHDARYAPPVEFTVYWIKPQDFLKWNKRLAWAGARAKRRR